jgi:hypothetical protein
MGKNHGSSKPPSAIAKDQRNLAVGRPDDRVADIDVMADWLDRPEHMPTIELDVVKILSLLRFGKADLAGNGNVAGRREMFWADKQDMAYPALCGEHNARMTKLNACTKITTGTARSGAVLGLLVSPRN